MDLTAAILPPLGAATLFTILLVLVRKRAAQVEGRGQFEAVLALLIVSSVTSVLWHSTLLDPRVSDALLRVLTWSDLSIAPALLAFLAARYPTVRSSLANRMAAAITIATGAVAASGAISRVILVPTGRTTLLEDVSAYAAVSVALATYLVTSGYAIAGFRAERDPFERNRIKYIWIATALITGGLLTNLSAALQRYPIDRGAEGLASLVMFYSLIRYRLFDIDLALNKVFVSLGSVVVVAPVYLLVTFRVVGAPLTQIRFGLDMMLLAPAVLATHLLRSRLQAVSDRVFLGHYVDAEMAAADFIERAQRLTNTRDLADLVASVCQHHFEARATIVMLHDPTRTRLQVASIQGPFASTYGDMSAIDLDNELLRLILQSRDPITPNRMDDLWARTSKNDHGQFASLRGCILQPVIAQGEIIGLIALADHVYDTSYSLNDLHLLSTIAIQVALAVESARLLEQVQAHADTDYLTGLPNHRHLKDVLARALDEAERAQDPVCVAMIDVDNFKLLNDTYGHVAGDDALQKIAGFLRSSVRACDIVGRYGGDEFLLILPDTNHQQGTYMLRRIAREARRISLVPEGDERKIPMRLSWGIATCPDDAVSVRTSVAAADSDLLRRRYVRRRAGDTHTNRPSLRHLRETDPRRVRIASGLLEVLDAKDNYTTEHSHQVASLALLLGEELRLSDIEREDLWLGALLHDIGKLRVPDEVVRKPGSLEPSEWMEIREHPIAGAEMMVGLFGESSLAKIVRSHHERFDGSGYPSGLAGGEIPYLARAVSVCDAYSAMVHDRPYRKGLSPSEAVEELRRGAGQQWDPEMVDAFVRVMRRDDESSMERRPIGIAQ